MTKTQLLQSTPGGAGWITSAAYSQGCLGCASSVCSASALVSYAANRCAVAVELLCQVAPRVIAGKIDDFHFFFSFF